MIAERTDFVSVPVTDLERSTAFYRDTLGLELAHSEVNESQGTHEAMMRVPGDTGTGTALQLLAPLSPDSTIGKFIGRKGPGLQQLAYRVTDIEAVTEALRAKGLRVLYEQPAHGTSNSRVNFVHPKDAGGVLIELVEPARDE